VTDELRSLDSFLDTAYLGQERMTSTEIQRSALDAELPAVLMTRIDALPEGTYTQDEASEALRSLAV
jgi:hypothetical protein